MIQTGIRKRLRGKSILIGIACLLLSLLCQQQTWAAEFSDYETYQNEDGTYTYDFMTGLKVTVSQKWYEATLVETDLATVRFYHKDSYQKYQSEGTDDGGLLLVIGTSVNHSFAEIPETEYLGFDEENALNYYTRKPTDYPAFTADESVREEYDALFAEVDAVCAQIELSFEAVQAAQENAAIETAEEASLGAGNDVIRTQDAADAADEAVTVAVESSPKEHGDFMTGCVLGGIVVLLAAGCACVYFFKHGRKEK